MLNKIRNKIIKLLGGYTATEYNCIKQRIKSALNTVYGKPQTVNTSIIHGRVNISGKPEYNIYGDIEGIVTIKKAIAAEMIDDIIPYMSVVYRVNPEDCTTSYTGAIKIVKEEGI